MRLIGNERKQEKKEVYFKKKKHPTPLINFVSLHSQKKKKKSFKVQRCDDFLWWYPVWRKSMHSFEDECCYTVARLASKLESGCRQLLHKLKSCEATQRKCASYEMYIAKKPSRWPESFIIFCGFVTKKKEQNWVKIHWPSVMLPGGLVKTGCHCERWDLRK